MWELLRAHDTDGVELQCGQGSLWIPPALGGRIFCGLNGELVHRLDAEALQHPSPTEYDNLGGNSLWPAPEGGPFAFNYLSENGAWTVQDGIAKSVPQVSLEDDNGVRIEKRIALTNRQGTQLDLNYRRLLWARALHPAAGRLELEGLVYDTLDVFEPLGDYDAESALLAPWSLEQFPGADGIVAFGKVRENDGALNRDFYGDPGKRIAWWPDHFVFRLGGKARHQIGVRVEHGPQCIGALDLGREMLFVRKTQPQQGTYFNIADNEQPDGPFSTADLYSVFNGGELDFFELETIGAMQTVNGRLATSSLLTQTVILRGEPRKLLACLLETEGLRLDESLLDRSV